MTELEYKKALDSIESKYRSGKKELIKAYAKEKALFQKGDIIECKKTGLFMIITEIVISISSFNNTFSIYYNGKELNKDSTIKSNITGVHIHQDNAVLVKKA